MKLKLILFVYLALCLIKAHKIIAQPSSQMKFENNIEAWLLEHKVPMIGIGIVENGAVIHTKVYEQPGKETPNLDGMLFDIASLTKTITAIATLNIIQHQTLALDEPVYKHYLDWDIKEDLRHQKLTVRHILSHQTGFPNWRNMTPTKKLNFSFTPGERYAYSGEGYEYLRKVLESKLETPFEAICDSILFAPLGMSTTRFNWDGSFVESQFAMGHDSQGNPYDKGKRMEVNAAAGVIVSIKDYTKFCAFVLNGARLSSAIYAEMKRPQVHVKNDLYYGLGWQVIKNLSNNQEAIFHFGGESGVRTFVLLFPNEKRGMALFTNSDNGQYVYEKVVKSYFSNGKEVFDLINKKTVFESKYDVKAESINAYIGTYKTEKGPTIEILTDNNVLKFKMPGAPLYDMYAQTENLFILDEELSVKFLRGSSGEIKSMIIFLNGVELFLLHKSIK